MDSDDAISISVIKNGYEVNVRDPEIVKSNQDSKKPYKDPMVEYNFEKIDEVLAFLKEVLPKLQPEDSNATFDAAFERAVATMKENDK